MITIENDATRLTFDQHGRIADLYSKATGTHFAALPGQPGNWRLQVLTGGYAVDEVDGAQQQPGSAQVEAQQAVFHYDSLVCGSQRLPIALDFIARLAGEEIRFQLALHNRSGRRIRELWAPVLRGFTGFASPQHQGKVHLAKAQLLAYDLLTQGLPRRMDPFRAGGEVCQFHYWPLFEMMQWWDLFCPDQGLYFSSDDRSQNLTAFRIERQPGGVLPEGAPRWLDLAVGKLVTVDDGEQFTMPESVLWPHQDDWHAAADHYRAWALSWMKFPSLPEPVRYYTGWQNLVGKTYLNEVYHTFDQLAEIMIEGKRRMGISFLQLYGHSEVGCEGANYSLRPGSNLGGPEGFRRMCDRLHQHDIRVIIFTHRQSAVALDRADEYGPYAAWVVRDRLGNVRKEAWWKTTLESLTPYIEGQNGLRFHEATAPVWARVCPSCDRWWDTFLDEIKQLVDLGCDGIQMDTNGAEGGICYAANHGHKPGEWMMPRVQERMQWLERSVHAYAPGFLLCAESVGDFYAQYCVLPYSRLRYDQGLEVYKYTFPELKHQVAVAAYSYDQVAKGFLLGYGFNCEVEGLKKTMLAYPDFADYIGQVNQVRVRHRDTLLDGRFIDTRGAQVSGQVRYGVHRGPRGLAVVVWNPHDSAQDCELRFEDPSLVRGVLCVPGQEDAALDLPAKLQVDPHRAVAVVAERS